MFAMLNDWSSPINPHIFAFHLAPDSTFQQHCLSRIQIFPDNFICRHATDYFRMTQMRIHTSAQHKGVTVDKGLSFTLLWDVMHFILQALHYHSCST